MEKVFLLSMLASAFAFYDIPPDATVIKPTTNEELTNALCSKKKGGHCVDNEFKVILVTKIFDFIDTEGNNTEKGCYHSKKYLKCLNKGQKKLNRQNQCHGLKKTLVNYDNAGIKGLLVGSNKYIISKEGGLKGKGLQVHHVNNVVIYGLSITDINAEVVWGGDAISVDNATNVLILRNYICRIGRQMIVTGHYACKNIIIAFNEFDGNSPYSARCDGFHYWLWLLEGSDDYIIIYNNYVHHTSGRGPHSTGLPNSKVLLHLIDNLFEYVKDNGLIEAIDPTSRILVEGNTFKDVTYIVSKNEGKIYYPFNNSDAEACIPYIERECYLNYATNTTKLSKGKPFKSDISVVQDIAKYGLVDTTLIDEFDKYIQQRNFTSSVVDGDYRAKKHPKPRKNKKPKPQI